MKRVGIVLLCLMLALLLGSCALVPEFVPPTEAPAPETAQPAQTSEQAASDPPAETRPGPERPSITWQTAFRSSKLPEGRVSVDEIAFYQTFEDGAVELCSVPKTEVLAWADAQQGLPRTHYYEQFMDEAVLELLPILDYALYHGYSRLSVPTTSFEGSMVNANSRCLSRMFRVNNFRINGLSVTTVPDGELSYDFVLITMPGMEYRNVVEQYHQGLDEARHIVAGMPQGLSEEEKAAYFYDYLTENVRYDYDDYYDGNWCLLYDTLVQGKTVCAGYADGFYYLCNLAGVDCITVEGYVKFTEGEGFHAWSEARIDGQWYLFDATWDAGRSPKRYQFYGLSDATLLERSPRDPYAFDQETAPPCLEDLTGS